MTDGAYWRGVPTTADTIATSAVSVTTASASMRFGIRPSLGQIPGPYVAPVTFEVAAPG